MTADQARKLLSEAVFSAASLREIVEMCAQILETPMRFTAQGKPNSGFLSKDYPIEDFLEWKELVTPNGEMTSAYRNFSTNEYAFLHGREPYFYPASPPVRRRRILCMAFVGSKRAGHISIPEMDVPLETIDMELVALCARFVALTFFQSGGADEALGDGKAMKLLVSGEKVTYPQVAGLASDQVFAHRGHYQLMALRLVGEDKPQRLTAVCARLTGWLASEWLAKTPRGAAILFESRAFQEEALRMLRDMLNLYGCACCLSPVYEDVMQTPVWHRRIFLLRPFKHAAAGDILDYQNWMDFGLYAEAGLNKEQLHTFIWPPILAMEAYDRENGTAYLPTLRMYFDQGANQKKTAEALFLHINTVAYRMQRMRELFGIAMEEPGIMGRAMRSVRLLQYLEEEERG
ncbi:MAG: helix-turn-helix domain-containing protein [Clostridia bacterium]|nr:helix-turn-helix domain-containing protein [Clostridia bacterium]